MASELSTEIFVLCDHATVSQEQKLSIIGIFDQFFVANLPANWPKMFLVTVLRGQPNSQYPLSLKIIPPQPTTQVLPEKQLEVTLGPNGKANLITELVNFSLPTPGTYKIQLLSDKKTVAEIEFKVNKTTPTYGGTDLKGQKITN